MYIFNFYSQAGRTGLMLDVHEDEKKTNHTYLIYNFFLGSLYLDCIFIKYFVYPIFPAV